MNIGLNKRANGWHCVASLFGKDYYDTTIKWRFCTPGGQVRSPLAWKVANKLSLITNRDSCACWCNPEGKGCSSLKSFWKNHSSCHEGLHYHWGQGGMGEALGHILFHHDIYNTRTEDNEPSQLSLELLRFLNFEALYMTHTCCTRKVQKCSEIFSDFDRNISHPHSIVFIADRDPEEVQEIRSSDL